MERLSRLHVSQGAIRDTAGGTVCRTILGTILGTAGNLMDYSVCGAQSEKNGMAKRVYIGGSVVAHGSRIVASEEVDRAFGMPAGKLRSRAGIESLAYAGEDENELSLGTMAAVEALRGSGADAGEMEWIVATSETHHNFPSLAAQLHSRLGVREECAALDVGGGCLGLVNAFAVAQSLIACGQARAVA